MKDELLGFIKKQYSENSQAGEILKFSEKTIDAIDKVKQQTKTAFLVFLKKYNFDTIPAFSEYPEYPYVTLFKGVDSWTLYPVIDYEGGVTDMDKEIGVVFTDPEVYPVNLEESEVGWELKERIILTWLSLIWFEIKGSSFGIVVKILENNSNRSFFFNDLSWDNLSDYGHYNNKNARLADNFPADLSINSDDCTGYTSGGGQRVKGSVYLFASGSNVDGVVHYYRWITVRKPLTRKRCLVFGLANVQANWR